MISSLNIRNYGLISESECESVFHRFEQQNLTAEGLSSPLTPNFHYICSVDSMVSGIIADDNIIKFSYIVEIYDEDDEDYDDE